RRVVRRRRRHVHCTISRISMSVTVVPPPEIAAPRLRAVRCIYIFMGKINGTFASVKSDILNLPLCCKYIHLQPAKPVLRLARGEDRMPVPALFGLSIVFAFVAWSVVATRYVWPHLRGQPRPEALRPLLMLHSFRFVGLSFLVPGVVSPDLPAAFANPAAYGDLIAAALALVALALLHTRAGIGLVWAFNLWGSADLL